jgi:hypothetical protein
MNITIEKILDAWSKYPPSKLEKFYYRNFFSSPIYIQEKISSSLNYATLEKMATFDLSPYMGF